MGTKVNRLKCRTNRVSLLVVFNTKTISVSDGLVLPLIKAPGTKNAIWKRSYKTLKKNPPKTRQRRKENPGGVLDASGLKFHTRHQMIHREGHEDWAWLFVDLGQNLK